MQTFSVEDHVASQFRRSWQLLYDNAVSQILTANVWVTGSLFICFRSGTIFVNSLWHTVFMKCHCIHLFYCYTVSCSFILRQLLVFVFIQTLRKVLQNSFIVSTIKNEMKILLSHLSCDVVLSRFPSAHDQLGWL